MRRLSILLVIVGLAFGCAENPSTPEPQSRVSLSPPTEPATGTVIVVNPGDDIQAAIDAANPGDTILLRAGTHDLSGDATPPLTLLAWTGRGTLNWPGEWPFWYSNSTITHVNKPLTFEGESGTVVTASKQSIPPDTWGTNMDYFLVDHPGVRFTGIHFQYTKALTILSVAPGLTVDNCMFTGPYNETPIMLTGDGRDVYPNYDGLDPYNPNDLYCPDENRTYIINNYFEDCTSGVVFAYSSEVTSQGNTFENTKVLAIVTGGFGLYQNLLGVADRWASNMYYNNVIENNTIRGIGTYPLGSFGILVSGFGDWGENLQVRHNTIEHFVNPIWIGYGVAHSDIRNNKIVNCSGPVVVGGDPGAGGIVGEVGNLNVANTNYQWSGLPGWNLGEGCLLLAPESHDVVVKDFNYPPGTSMCTQILDLGSSNEMPPGYSGVCNPIPDMMIPEILALRGSGKEGSLSPSRKPKN